MFVWIYIYIFYHLVLASLMNALWQLKIFALLNKSSVFLDLYGKISFLIIISLWWYYFCSFYLRRLMFSLYSSLCRKMRNINKPSSCDLWQRELVRIYNCIKLIRIFLKLGICRLLRIHWFKPWKNFNIGMLSYRQS